MKIMEENLRFAAYEEGHEIGEVTWSASEHLLIIDHTYVDASYRGQGIAERLVKAVVDKARSEGYKIIPLCPFAKREFERQDTYKDVLK